MLFVHDSWMKAKIEVKDIYSENVLIIHFYTCKKYHMQL